MNKFHAVDRIPFKDNKVFVHSKFQSYINNGENPNAGKSMGMCYQISNLTESLIFFKKNIVLFYF